MKRLAELPPGMPRLALLNGDLDTAELNDLAVGYAHFVPWVAATLESAAREGAVLVEVRLGPGPGWGRTTCPCLGRRSGVSVIAILSSTPRQSR